MVDRLTRKEVAAYLVAKFKLKVAPQTLARMATEGVGPPFQKFGRQVLYDETDVDKWVEQRLSSKVRSSTELRALEHARP